VGAYQAPVLTYDNRSSAFHKFFSTESSTGSDQRNLNAINEFEAE